MFVKGDLQQPTSIKTEYTIKDGIANEGLAHFQTTYPTETITK
jgi:hypothetical protein